ncbi:MAG: D-alanyl-D-alanine carboxypeptidase [Clostridiales bacterium]|nr:D-alanyl-D-alanine carboxypeptidase [Clostridiales bacterium]
MTRVFSVLAVILLLSSLLSFPVVAEDDTSSSETIEDLVNPVEGLLDPDPSGVPVSGARSYLIYDTLSDTMLIGKDFDSRRQPAAITQIMTVLIALEELELSDKITITKDMYETIPKEYVRIGFDDGEVLTVEQCIYACLLKSANDACMALAIHISGSESAFVEKMNKRAEELGCTSTHFTNPYGNADAEHLTTCRDMVLILKEALRHPDYRTISTTASFTIESTNKFNDKRVLNNANRFVSTPSTAYEYYIGGKTGYSDTAGYTIIAGAEKDGRCLIGVMLGAEDAELRYEALVDLFEYCFNSYTTTMVDENEMAGAVNSAISQIESALSETPLKVQEKTLTICQYYSVKSELANNGYSNEVDLSKLVIDPVADNQEFQLPIYRRFSNDETYKIGYLKITIGNGDAAPVPTEKAEDGSGISIREILLIVAVGVVLLVILILSIVFLLKMMKKRKFNKHHKNPTIL